MQPEPYNANQNSVSLSLSSENQPESFQDGLSNHNEPVLHEHGPPVSEWAGRSAESPVSSSNVHTNDNSVGAGTKATDASPQLTVGGITDPTEQQLRWLSTEQSVESDKPRSSVSKVIEYENSF